MKIAKLATVCCFFLLSVTLIPIAHAATCIVNKDGHAGFLPENNLKIPVGSKMAGSMTKKRFNEIIDEVDRYYRPIVRAKGGMLKFNRKWDDATVNASAQRMMKLWVVNMYGGLARHAIVTDDAFTLVICHELGHHLGGAPKIGGDSHEWASNEGQADYFGTLKCFRHVFETADNQAVISGMSVDPLVKKSCDVNFQTANDRALCVRASVAGKSLADLLASLGGDRETNFNTPDPSVVDETDDEHPAAQCRLDTYFQGSLCNKNFSDSVDDRDASKGTCTLARGTSVGTRPLCWYKP